MIPVTSFRNKKVALFGLGGSGLISARALLEGGAELTAFDDNPAQVEQAAADGIPTGDLREGDFSRFEALVLAPGVPLTHPKPHWTVELANAASVPVVGDIELFVRERQAKAPGSPFVAITGTNGKSTTTALVSHILASAGRDVQMGGNIGKAVLSLEPPGEERIHVVECSSYQIDLAPSLDPQVGLFLNLSPDHLERHGTLEAYCAIKKRLVAKARHAVIGVDDRLTAEAADELEGKGCDVWRISVRGPISRGIEVRGDALHWWHDGDDRKVADIGGVATLRGIHNSQNAGAAWIACHLNGLDEGEIQTGLKTFPGLAHRMEIVGSIGKVMFVNDSKATNADAAAMALGGFENIYWIAGGLAKEGGIDGLRPHFQRITKAYLIGEAAASFAATLGDDVAYEISGTLEAAVANAFEEASKDKAEHPVVLLSPACASFDQFANFEKRGEAYKQAIIRFEGLIPYAEAE